MHDLAILELLSTRGFQGESAGPALERLYRAGLTRSGKTRIATVKIDAADRALAAVFVPHCQWPVSRSAREARFPARPVAAMKTIHA